MKGTKKPPGQKSERLHKPCHAGFEPATFSFGVRNVCKSYFYTIYNNRIKSTLTEEMV